MEPKDVHVAATQTIEEAVLETVQDRLPTEEVLTEVSSSGGGDESSIAVVAVSTLAVTTGFL